MNKSKVLLFLALFLLVSQLFSPNLGLLAESSKAKQDDASMLKVEAIGQDGEQIHWKVVVNEAKKEQDEMKTTISIGTGLTHGKIDHASDASVETTGNGYVVESSKANTIYEFSI